MTELTTQPETLPTMRDAPAWLRPMNLAEALNVAETLATSKLVPDHFRGDAGGVLFCLDMAARLDVAPLAFMQKAYAIHGKVGFEYPLILTALTRVGVEYDWLERKPDRVTLELRKSGAAPYRETFDRERAESITIGGKTLWAKWTGNGMDTTTMLGARCVSFACRAYAPHAMFGGEVYVRDELEEMAERRQAELVDEPTKGVASVEHAIKRRHPDAVLLKPKPATEPEPDDKDKLKETAEALRSMCEQAGVQSVPILAQQVLGRKPSKDDPMTLADMEQLIEHLTHTMEDA